MSDDAHSDPTPGYSLANDLATSTDALDFTPYVTALTRIITSPDTGTPLTVGIYGPWGSGKTSLMMMVRDLIQERSRGQYITVWFDAWKYAHEDALWRALILRVLATLRSEVEGDLKRIDQLDKLETSLYRGTEYEELGEVSVDWVEAGKAGAKGLARMALHLIPGAGPALDEVLKSAQSNLGSADLNGLFNAIRRERHTRYRERIQSLEQFQEEFGKLVAALDNAHDKRLVVFVDDLDRCLPEKAVEVLEGIKLFMDVPGCIFLLGLDRQVIARGIEIKYKEIQRRGLSDAEQKRQFVIEGTRYLEKIIQLPFQIPPIEEEQISSFVEGLMPDWPYPGCAKVFAVGLGQSPRRVKRTINSFLLLWALKEARDIDVSPVRLAKVVVLQQMEPDLYDLLKESPRYLRDLERYIRKQSERSESGRTWAASSDALETTTLDLPPPLVPFSSRVVLHKLLALEVDDDDGAVFGDLTPDQLRLYFTLTRRTEAPGGDLASDSPSLLEPETVYVPAGPFMMGTRPDEDGRDDEKPQHEVTLSAYRVGKYPVTNAEYQAFVRIVRHQPPPHWEGDAYPANKGDHPVVRVSQSDAVAYCEWLTKETGKQYMLPSEAEWEKAARGAEGWVYPWGNDWNASVCNSRAVGRDDTSPVGQYSPGGDSPYGAADMAGNIWEWTRDRYDSNIYRERAETEVVNPTGPKEGSNYVLRGGAFYSDRYGVRCAFRSNDHPLNLYDLGFRVVVHSTSGD